MINREYYGCDELHEGEFADLAAEPLPGGVALTEEMLREVIARIYRAKGYTPGDIDPQLYEAILETFRNAVNEGLTEAKAAGTPMPGAEFINRLMENTEVFSAFRTHRMERDMAARMVDDEGRLKPFSRFAKDVEPITRHHVRAWLRTEYDTAVLRAHQAADWKRFERNADILPNLRWIKSTSVEPGADHKIFWGTVRPIDDDFWSAHRPGDRWNCKCSLAATDDEPTAEPVVPRNDRHNMPGRGLENNPGKDGKIFSDRHPYFAESCATCPFKGSSKKGGLMALVAKKRGDCYECRSVKRSTSSAERHYYLEQMEPLLKRKVIKEFEGKRLNVGFTKKGNKHLYSDSFGRTHVVTKEDLKNLDSYLEDAKYIDQSALTHSRTDNIEHFYYFKVQVNGKWVRLNVAKEVKRHRNGRIYTTFFLYSVNDITE